jgi:hypothetical protein
MIKIFNKTTNEFLGRVTEEDLQFLVDQLEEESLDDHDYFLLKETIEEFEQLGGSSHLVQVLKGGLKDQGNIEIRWERDKEA